MKNDFFKYKHLSVIAFIIAMFFSITSNAAPEDHGAKPKSKPELKPFTFTVSTDIESKSEKVVIGINIDSLDSSYYFAIENNEVIDVKEKPYAVEYDLDCDGDGKYELIGQKSFQKCVYQRNTGKHQIRIRGQIPSIKLCDMENIDEALQSVDNKNAVVSVDNWGDVKWKSMAGFASECKYLNAIPSKAPHLKDVKSVGSMFHNAESFNHPINHWDMSNVRDMAFMFEGAKAFNQPLDKWNVSKVINMTSMFSEATAFNQPLDKWNVSNACYMEGMFQDASSYSHYPSKWTLADTGWKPPAQYPPAQDYIFEGTKIEEKEKANPLKMKKRKHVCSFY